jgi:uncharacterized protein (DUF1330 family)
VQNTREYRLRIFKNMKWKKTYQCYLKLVENNFKKTKVGKILYYEGSQDFLIGPQDEKWDSVLLIEYDSFDDFVNVIRSEDYQKIKKLRAASLEDSILLPASNSIMLEVKK